jgi:putative ABC transport system ATP-binding protein
MNQTPLVALSKVTRAYRTTVLKTLALADIDLEILRGEYLAIEGPSGSGKSTLLTVLGLLEEPDSGTYLLNGATVSDLRDGARARIRSREIGFVFQSFHLIPEMTTAENIAMPLLYRADLPSEERRNRVARVLAQVGMADRASHYPSQLSGGQQQRVAVARALVGAPSLLLADEPTGNLDHDNGLQVLALFDELNRAGVTVVMVTHNPEYAARASRRVTLMDGQIVNTVGAA